ncbi:class I SAM-dependent methyltransferase [Pseudomonas petrae]|uniref:Class I SAM-dependent methyltransferase n=1 Tax=Pseudomonas petrae TaxID=2912190 RepID=A0ABS9IDE0_9PSED|nr:class I SAM-dependent methyltransferase [Pseudomonas petrae]MCF7545254.1 class I SAM-dependent methyltransferase [Pseudomonas petrae]
MPSSPTLSELYNQHSGLVSDKWDSYLSVYERSLAKYVRSPIQLLEIGVQNGGSLEIWSHYFSNARAIVGCDINRACAGLNYDNPKTHVVIGDIKMPETLSAIMKHAESFEIIIDDGSHTSQDIIKTFAQMFPHLNNDGVYIVEDLHCSYWKQFEGGLFSPHSSMSFFKALTDILNFEHWGLPNSRLSILEPFKTPPELTEAHLAQIHSVEFVNSMCIITKKEPSCNILGRRRVSGEVEQISPVKQVNNTYNKAPPQP